MYRESSISFLHELHSIPRGTETSMETMNRTTMCSQPNLQDQVYIAIRLEYKDMKNLCLHLGGNIAVQLKNGFEKIPKIGKNNICMYPLE